MRRVVLFSLGLCVVLTAGCRGLSYDEEITIDKDLAYHETEFRGDKNERTVDVTAGREAPVNVYLLLIEDKPDAVTALRANKKPRKTLASAQATKEAKLEGKIPAGQGFVVLIQPVEKGKEIKVKLGVHER
jgi:hypothetical protein